MSAACLPAWVRVWLLSSCTAMRYLHKSVCNDSLIGFSPHPHSAPTPCLCRSGHGSCTEIGRAAVLPTGQMSWRGAKVSVPGDVCSALEQRYGADWRVPRYMDKVGVYCWAV